MAIESKFEKSGTLEKPGPIGRLIRFALGTGSLFFVWKLLLEGYWLANNATGSIMFWFLLAFGVHIFPYVINIGFTKSWGRRPQIFLIFLAIGAGIWSFIQSGNIWPGPMGWLMVVWLFYVYGHLGISFVVASIIGTPGCEMRAIPHLWTRITSKETKEHYCAGFLNGLDAWERKVKGTVETAK